MTRHECSSTYEEIIERWRRKAEDRGEHKRFVLTGNDTTSIRNFLEEHDMPYTSEQPEVPENQVPMLYPAKLSLICHGRVLSSGFKYQIKHNQ